jgi:hypothetical protein
MAEEVPLPRYNALKRMEKAIELSQWLSSYRVSNALTQHDIDVLANMVCSKVPGYYAQIKQTLLQLIGHRPSKPQMTRLGWQLVGRQEEMDRRPIPMVDTPAANGWVAVRIDSMSDISWSDDKPGYSLNMFVLSGSAAGFTIKRNVPAGWTRFIAYKVGFSRRMEYQDEPKHLIGLVLWAYAVSKPEGLEMTAWNIDDKMLKHNKAILKLRNRHFFDDGPECPFELDTECVECTRLTHECQASIRHSPDTCYV